MSSRNRVHRVIALFTVAIAGSALFAGVATESARADSSNGHHYVAFLRGDDMATNSVLLVNSVDGGTICYDVSSLTKPGGPYTTRYDVTNGNSVEYYMYHSNNCTYTTLYFQSAFTPGHDLRKYYYLTV